MKKITKRLVIATVLALILLAVITGTVFAANGNPDKGNQGEECPYGECVNDGCIHTIGTTVTKRRAPTDHKTVRFQNKLLEMGYM